MQRTHPAAITTHPRRGVCGVERDRLAARTWPKDFICLTLGGEPLPFEENGTEWLYRLACDHQGRVEGCTGYATLIDLRGEPGRAREYRERASLLASRRE